MYSYIQQYAHIIICTIHILKVLCSFIMGQQDMIDMTCMTTFLEFPLYSMRTMQQHIACLDHFRACLHFRLVKLRYQTGPYGDYKNPEA